MKTKTEKRIHVGEYKLGSEWVRLYLIDDYGGHFRVTVPKGQTAEINVGGNNPEWWEVLRVLMHEVLELSSFRLGVRFNPSPDYSEDSGNYIFVMSHAQFSEATARAALFLAAAAPDLQTVWRRQRKGRQRG